MIKLQEHEMKYINVIENFCHKNYMAIANVADEHEKTNHVTQRAEEILNNIWNNINKTFTRLISVLHGFQKCIAWNPSNKGVEWPCYLAQQILPYFGESAKIGSASYHGPSMP